MGGADVAFAYVPVTTKEDHLKEAMIELLAPHINVTVLQQKNLSLSSSNEPC